MIATQNKIDLETSSLKKFVPPIILKGLRQTFAEKREPIRFTGDYLSWEDAERDSTGYAASEILDKTRRALLKVKAGEAAFERDSVTFDAMQFEFPLLAGLLRAAGADDGRLSVLDFGGALGSSYFQCRQFLSVLKDLRWSVVDQPAQVACGTSDFANNELHFYDTIEECMREQKPNVLLLSSVIQYLRLPYEFLKRVLEKRIQFVIIERTAFNCSDRDRLTVQRVPKWFYNASYPAWFLSETALRKEFSDHAYEIVCEHTVDENLHPEGERAVFKGFQFCFQAAAGRV
jgi:putative methyltransferase (TIGR04325 family)